MLFEKFLNDVWRRCLWNVLLPIPNKYTGVSRIMCCISPSETESSSSEGKKSNSAQITRKYLMKQPDFFIPLRDRSPSKVRCYLLNISSELVLIRILS